MSVRKWPELEKNTDSMKKYFIDRILELVARFLFFVATRKSQELVNLLEARHQNTWLIQTTHNNGQMGRVKRHCKLFCKLCHRLTNPKQLIYHDHSTL